MTAHHPVEDDDGDAPSTPQFSLSKQAPSGKVHFLTCQSFGVSMKFGSPSMKFGSPNCIFFHAQHNQ